MPRGAAYVFAGMCTHVRLCVHVRAGVCARVIREIKHPCKDNANSLITCTLYTR